MAVFHGSSPLENQKTRIRSFLQTGNRFSSSPIVMHPKSAISGSCLSMGLLLRIG